MPHRSLSGLCGHLDDRLRDQFSALVSFAYNIGLTAFSWSSVLRAVNAGQFKAVPGLMALWVKAGGKVLPGLLARRAAEAALFCETDDAAHEQGTNSPRDVGWVEPIAKNLASPNTIGAALISAVGGIMSSAARHLEDLIGQHLSLVLEITAVAAVLGCAAWIILENRSRSWQPNAWIVLRGRIHRPHSSSM